MESRDVDESFKQSRQQVCKHVVFDREGKRNVWLLCWRSRQHFISCRTIRRKIKNAIDTIGVRPGSFLVGEKKKKHKVTWM